MPNKKDIRYRTVEWQHSICMFLIGIILLLPIETMQVAAFTEMVKLMTEPMWGFLFLFTGMMRMIALFINGQAPKGSPAARLLGSIIGVALFTLVTTTLILAGALFGATLCFIIAVFELKVIYNSTRDLKNDVYA
jgi:hypothetical protein